MDYILGIPLHRSTVNTFRNHIWKRYMLKDYPDYNIIDVQNADRSIAYMERIIDRLINKARGILPFNSILLTIIQLERQQEHNTILVSIALGSLVFSSVILLMLFLVHWGNVSHYENANNEFEKTVDIIWKRSGALQAAVLLSIIGLVCMAWIGIFDYVPPIESGKQPNVTAASPSAAKPSPAITPDPPSVKK